MLQIEYTLFGEIYESNLYETESAPIARDERNCDDSPNRLQQR